MASLAPQHSSRMKKQSSFWTRSTIYNRNEARRAKTLQNAHDTRPAAVRVLAQLTGATSASTSCAVSTTRDQPQLQQQLQQSEPMIEFEDNNVFTKSDYAGSLTSATSQSKSLTSISSSTAALTAGISAAFGAQFSEVACKSSVLQQARKIAVPPQKSSVTSVFVSGDSLALSTLSPPPSSNTTNSSFVSRARPAAGMVMAPLFVLFGSKAWIEAQLNNTRNDTDGNDATHHQPISMASLTASAMAGACLSVIKHQQQLLMTTSSHHRVASEACAAVVYFGSYELIKGAVLGRSISSSQNDPLHSMVAVGTAGAVAGSFYEVMRVYGTSSSLLLGDTVAASAAGSSTAAASPFAPRLMQSSLSGIVRRAAPAHAMLFLGYETAKSVLNA